LQRLVHSLQELSRAEASQLNIERRSCHAGELVETVAEWLRPQFDGKGVKLDTILPDNDIVVMADYDRIRQVLINILGNALRYTPEGGSVVMRLEEVGEEAQFSVEDTGRGIPQDAVDLIFQRFYRVDKSRSRASGGSGVGLTIARHIVEAHGGRIWAESEGVGTGSKFHFSLPLS
jgi:histidine kinase